MEQAGKLSPAAAAKVRAKAHRVLAKGPRRRSSPEAPVAMLPDASKPATGEDILRERIERAFTYHAPKGDQAQRYEKLRFKAKELALLMTELCPDSRERSFAIGKIEEAVFWANAAIARELA
jgi:hypothetical protein